MVKPITPSEVSSGKCIPDEVVEAFNELIVECGGCVRQVDAVARILSKMPGVSRETIFARGWLDIEAMYRKAGWRVVYDKPGYNEDYEANWQFG